MNDDFEKVDNIITNPPYKYAKEFIEKALETSNNKVAMFCKIQLLEGVSRYELFKNSPLKTVYVFTKRQNPLRNGNPVDENGKNGLVQCVLHGLYLNTDIKENQQ